MLADEMHKLDLVLPGACAYKFNMSLVLSLQQKHFVHAIH